MKPELTQQKQYEYWRSDRNEDFKKDTEHEMLDTERNYDIRERCGIQKISNWVQRRIMAGACAENDRGPTYQNS